MVKGLAYLSRLPLRLHQECPYTGMGQRRTQEAGNSTPPSLRLVSYGLRVSACAYGVRAEWNLSGRYDGGRKSISRARVRSLPLCAQRRIARASPPTSSQPANLRGGAL